MKVILQSMMQRRGLSQTELSRRSGVPQPMISDIINKNVLNPRITTMLKLATALKCAVDDLIEEDDNVTN